MEKQYKHNDHEERVYSLWEKGGAFQPISSLKAKPFCIIMPPPNANDPLHVGHAMFVTLEDILIRYHRMLGDATLWLPGSDHAGIETQFVFEKKLKKQRKSRFDFDRETLYKNIWDYVQDNSDVAVTQLKKIGASADWSRFKFMLDTEMVRIVIETFKELADQNLVYRDLRLVNYCTHCGTAFSELEVKHIEKTTPLYYMKYGPFSLATVRPETKFGDTAVAVNPNDKRYKKWIGKEIEVKGLVGNFTMKVVADDFVDPTFGTGVVKVTPAHDPNDFEIWQRHKDEISGPKQVVEFDGKLNEFAGKYAGLYVAKARQVVAEDLESAGLMERVDTTYMHMIGVCYRCGNEIEPLPLPQFFIKVKSLANKALEVLENEKVIVHGAGHDKVLKHWLENLKDWNISRQIIWGIRIPVWYSVEKNPDISVVFLDKAGKKYSGVLKDFIKKYSLSEIRKGLQSLRAPLHAEYVISPGSPGMDFIQETDTFDTWFSSAQFPFTSLMTAKKGDFKRFYPTSVMETGYDILPFWVMRMLMIGLYKTGEVPFRDVYLHGLIRDEKGQKMSKSKGNVINPLDVVEHYGADALRMALVIRSTPGQDKNVGEQDFRAMRNFTNKIWNAARFIILNFENSKQHQVSSSGLEVNDSVFQKKLNSISEQITRQISEFRIGLAAETVYNEFWHWFCDECIEKNKHKEISDPALLDGLVVFLKLLHPFVPFVTEAVYMELRQQFTDTKRPTILSSKQLISAPWPLKISSEKIDTSTSSLS